MSKSFRALAAGLSLLTASCNTDVINPGPVDDSSLDRNAATALVNGSGRALAQAINWISYTGAAVSREIHPAGSTGSFGITSRWQQGELEADDDDLNTHWEQATRARWLAEESVRRLIAVGPPTPGVDVQTPTAYANALRQAHVYAGFANRLLAENMCDVVIDGGPLVTGNADYLQRAEDAFTAALAVTGGTNATALNEAATAGRASIRMYQGDWTGAVADASAVGSAASYTISYFSVGDDTQRNRIAYSSGNTRESGSAYRAHTQWSTWPLEYKYGNATAAPTGVPVVDDPRILIATSTAAVGDAAIECCGSVPFYPQNKHVLSTAPIRLTGGREMLLIRAENELVNTGGVAGAAAAITLIDQARTAAGAPTILASWDGTVNDAWRLLKRERGIELWLEARRMGDRRRWITDARPGALNALELPDATYPGTTSHLNPAVHDPADARTFCFPVSRSERITNPNIPDA